MLDAISPNEDESALCVDRCAFEDANTAAATLCADAPGPVSPQHPAEGNDQQEYGDESESEAQKDCEVHTVRWALI